MLAKYKIEYVIPFTGHDQPHQYLTDEPVACEEFLSELLERGVKIDAVLHEGVTLPATEFDSMIKKASRLLATRNISRSLGIDLGDAFHRFG